MNAEKQYLELYQSSSRMIKKNSAEVLNAVRDAAFEDFRRLGFPSRKVERYKYTDMSAIFEPDYGLNLKRLDIPVDPYEAFRCDVPNLSTSLYFVVNDSFYSKALPKVELPVSARASSESRTSYGRDSTCSTNSLGGRIPLKGFTIAIIDTFMPHHTRMTKLF